LREVTPRLIAALGHARGISHKLVLDTYIPEVERYGGDLAMPLAEQTFEADSDAALEILSAYRTDRHARWRLCLLGMKALLDDLDLPTETVEAMMVAARDGQMRKFYESVATTKAMGTKYRAVQKEVTELLEKTPERYSRGVDAIRRRGAALAEPFARLRVLEECGALTQTRPQIAISYLHMWANRMCRGSANAQELVMYDILARYAAGKLARARRKASAAPVVNSTAADAVVALAG
jgi:thiopeptide-type bacteriocin biosynthesis protein